MSNTRRELSELPEDELLLALSQAFNRFCNKHPEWLLRQKTLAYLIDLNPPGWDEDIDDYIERIIRMVH